MHEAKMHPENCFITLTYNDESVPQNYGLDLKHWQLFMYRLRDRLAPKRIRFFACGEYGDETGRPHYHAVIFNHDFQDKVLHDKNAQGDPLYTSELLTEIWGQGHCVIGAVDFKSAAYVARYCIKKINGPLAAPYYFRVSPIDGKTYTVRPEFAVMSRRPGIGTTWFEKFRSDIYPSGFIVVNGVKQSPPTFYKLKLTEDEQKALKRKGRENSIRFKDDTSTERRLAIAAVRDARISSLKRKL